MGSALAKRRLGAQAQNLEQVAGLTNALRQWQ
jgi:hypothetical protein